jgi:hypothetical protein
MKNAKEKIIISDELFLTKSTRELMDIFKVTKQYVNKLRRERGLEASKIKEGRPRKGLDQNILYRVKTNRMALDEAADLSGCAQITIVRRLRKDKASAKPMEAPTHFDLYVSDINSNITVKPKKENANETDTGSS